MEARKAFVFCFKSDFLIVTKRVFLLLFCRHVLLSCRSPGGLCDQSDLHISPYQESRICPHFTLIPSPDEGLSVWTDSGFWVSNGLFFNLFNSYFCTHMDCSQARVCYAR